MPYASQHSFITWIEKYFSKAQILNERGVEILLYYQVLDCQGSAGYRNDAP
jgi:hypothetical protein